MECDGEKGGREALAANEEDPVIGSHQAGILAHRADSRPPYTVNRTFKSSTPRSLSRWAFFAHRSHRIPPLKTSNGRS